MANTHQTHAVYVRQHWKDSWVAVPYLYADSFTRCMAPAMPTAQLAYRYGDILRPGTTAFAEFDSLPYLGWYVKIVLQQGAGTALEWYGVIIDSSKMPQGVSRTDTNAPNKAGEQQLTAIGLEYLLDRQPILTSECEDGAGQKTINRPLTFNPIRHLGSGFRDKSYEGNASYYAGSAGGGAVIFAETLTSAAAKSWTARGVVEYMLGYQAPKDGNGVDVIPFTLDTSANALTGLEFEVRDFRIAERETVFRVLNRLIARHRGLGWSLTVVADVVVVTVHSFAVDRVSIPASNNGAASVLPANANKTAWNFDADALIHNPQQAESVTQVFDQVLIRGARRGSIFTLSTDSGTLVKDWSSAQETAYMAGASGIAGYASLNLHEKQRLHILTRSLDKLKRVYRYFRLKSSWDGKDAAGNVVCPDLLTPTVSVKFWQPGLRFAKFLPLFNDHDYSGSKIGDGTVTNNTPTGAIAEYLRPVVAIHDTDGYWWPAEGLNDAAPIELLNPTATTAWAFHTQMQDETAGIVLALAGHGQHAIAKNYFTPHDTADNYTAAVIDYSNSIFATVFVEFDEYLISKYPDDPVTPDGDAVRRLILDMPDLRLDYVAPGTLIGIDESGATITSDGGYVRDDRDMATAFATLAWQWYGAARKTLNLTRHSLILATGIDVGTMVTTIGTDPETINTVVTRIVFDTRQGTANYLTQFAEFDLSGL